MFDCHQDERVFWKTMNPARLHALYNAYFSPVRRIAIPAGAPEPQGGKSLAAYLMGGG